MWYREVKSKIKLLKKLFCSKILVWLPFAASLTRTVKELQLLSLPHWPFSVRVFHTFPLKSWPVSSRFIYHIWFTLLSKARAGSREKECLLENLKYLSKWKRCTCERFLTILVVSKVKSLNVSSPNHSSYISRLQLQDFAHHVRWNPTYSVTSVVNVRICQHEALWQPSSGIYEWPLFKNLLNFKLK